MPDRTNDSKAQSKIPPEIYNAFLDWMRSSPKYSFQYSLYKLTNQLKNDAVLKDNPYFQQFLVERNFWQPAYLKEFGITQPPALQSPGTEATMRQRVEEWKALAGTQPGLPQIQSSGGYDWQLVDDPDNPGQKIWQNIGRTDTSSAEARRQFDIQFGQKQADIMNQQRANELAGQAQASQNIAQMAFGGGTYIGERNAQNAYKAQLAKQFEDTMRDILSTTAPRDWVVRAKAQQALQNNPFAPASQTFGDQFDAASQNEAFYKTSLESKKRDIENAKRDPRISVTDQDMQEFAALEIKLDLAKKQRQAAEKRFIESDEPQFAEPRATAFGGFEVGRPSETAQPKEIGIPKELSQAFGITKFGQTPARPSGQQWNRATFTAREQLAGYNEALGANWTDVLDQMAMERPQNLTLGRTWQPARSMI